MEITSGDGGGSELLRQARAHQETRDHNDIDDKPFEEQAIFLVDFEDEWSKRHSSPITPVETEGQQLSSVPPRAPHFIQAMGVLLRFRTVNNFRSSRFVAPRLMDKVLFALILMSLYWGIGKGEDVQSQQSTAAMLYFVVVLCGFGAAAVVPTLTMERALFYRERNDGCYNSCEKSSGVLPLRAPFSIYSLF